MAPAHPQASHTHHTAELVRSHQQTIVVQAHRLQQSALPEYSDCKDLGLHLVIPETPEQTMTSTSAGC